VNEILPDDENVLLLGKIRLYAFYAPHLASDDALRRIRDAFNEFDGQFATTTDPTTRRPASSPGCGPFSAKRLTAAAARGSSRAWGESCAGSACIGGSTSATQMVERCTSNANAARSRRTR
jgi:hypothetical protein